MLDATEKQFSGGSWSDWMSIKEVVNLLLPTLRDKNSSQVFKIIFFILPKDTYRSLVLCHCVMVLSREINRKEKLGLICL